MRKFGLIATAMKGTALLIVVLGVAYQAKAQDAANPYPAMAPVEQYMMDRNDEIALARSAAPASISGDATVYVLGKQGYEKAVEGKNGFVCLVDRGWMGAFDWPEFWNPKIRAAGCLNPQAARWDVPVEILRSKMTMAGRSQSDVLAAVKAGYAKKELPQLEMGAMCYMMSKPSYLTDQDGHNMPHLMFYATVDAKDWGVGSEGVPIMAAPFWFFMSKDPAQTKGLPPVVVFLVGAATWADGTPAGQHNE